MPSEKEFVVLSLLARHSELYGLELVSLADGALKRGTVYVTLARMQDKGYIRARRPAGGAHSGLPRPRYRLTALGERALRAAGAAHRVFYPRGAT
jgi:DNA-binding PadR family transcriptional regulator